MYQIYYSVFLILFVDILQFAKGQSCSEEEYIKNKKIIWRSSQISSSVVSYPPCIDKDNILVNRTCFRGKWTPKNHNCVSVQEPFRAECLKNHRLDKNGYCVYISEKQPWTSELPVADVIDLTKESSTPILQTILRGCTYFWLPINRTENYGKFVWRIPINHGIKYGRYIFNESDYALRNCMAYRIINGISYIMPEFCKTKLPIVHAYKLESRYFMKQKKSNITIHFSTSNNNMYFLHNKCQTLAQPKTKEDNFAIKKLFTNEVCKIGIERDKNGTFKWKNTTQNINYTDWMPSTNFSNSIVVITKDGWKLENIMVNMNCSVCQIDHTKYKTELSLQPNIDHTHLIMIVYSTQKISYINAHTKGLEDIELGISYNKFPVYNDYSKIQNPLEKFDERKVWIVNIKDSWLNYYRFNALILPSAEQLTTDEIFFSNNVTGREYAFELKIKKLCNTKFICDPHLNNFHKDLSNALLSRTNKIMPGLSDGINGTKIASMLNITNYRAVKILEIEKDEIGGDIKILYHVRTNSKMQNFTKERIVIRNILSFINKTYLNTEFSIKYDKLKSCSWCFHNSEYINNLKTEWKYTEIGRNSTFKFRNILYTRKCGGDYINGAKWERPVRLYENSNQQSQYTIQFQEIFENISRLPPIEVVKSLSNLTTNKLELKATDIYYVSEIIRNVSESNFKMIEQPEIFAKSITSIMNDLIACNATALEESNQATNSTNILLATVEKTLQEVTEHHLVHQIVEDNFIHHTSDPFETGITGLALIRPNAINEPHFSEYKLMNITANMTIEDIIAIENLDTAVYVPEQLLDDIRNRTLDKIVRISIIFYFNDSLFIENNTTSKNKVTSKIIDVNIKGYDNYLYSAIPVITKMNKNSSLEKLCAHWDFGSQIKQQSSKWKADYNLDTQYLDDIQICYYNHLTNFAMLLGKKVKGGNDVGTGSITQTENLNLQIITAVGCLLSIIGICIIFLTAMIFKSWRQQFKSKVLLNVSFCNLLLILMLYLNSHKNRTLCMVSGSLLHYSVLCGFSWSLIMALFQYLRFVKVLGGRSSHLLLKSVIVGWILPIIPVTIAFLVNYFTEDEYVTNLEELGSNICYPQGLMFYLTLLLPVTVIVIANLVIFILIQYNIAKKPKFENMNTDNKVTVLQFKLAVLLFFLLGLTWVTGLITFVLESIVFLYIFCATASSQGFVLFIFYIILDQSTRRLWCNKIRSAAQFRKTSEQTNFATADTNTYNTTKEESGVSLSEVADWNSRSQNVMQELQSTHRKK